MFFSPPPPSLAAVTGSLPLGGSSTFLLNLTQARNSRGESLPIIVTSEENEMSAEFGATGASVQMVHHRKRIYEDRLKEAYRLLAEHRPRAVLACLSAESFEVLRLVPPGVSRIGIIQSDDPLPYAMARRYGAWIDAMVGVSAEICQKLRASDAFAGARIEHIPYGIAFPKEELRASDNETRPLRIVYLGRIAEEQKRVSRLAVLAEILEKANANVEFTIAGAGAEANRLRAAVGNCSLVRWRGPLDNREVLPFLREQDVFVLLSDYEGLPLSLLEAMGVGVVPVISDLPSGIRELVTSDRGIRVPIGDVAFAAEAIMALERDRAHTKSLSAAARQYVRAQYSAEQMDARFTHLVEVLEPASEAKWPASVSVPTPLGVTPQWMYRGAGRQLRRILRRLSR